MVVIILSLLQLCNSIILLFFYLNVEHALTALYVERKGTGNFGRGTL